MAEEDRDVTQADGFPDDPDAGYEEEAVALDADDTASDSSSEPTGEAEPVAQPQDDVDDRGVPWRNRAAENERKLAKLQAERDELSQRYTSYVAQTQPVIERQFQQSQPPPQPQPQPQQEADPQVQQAYDLLKPHIERDIDARTNAAEQRAANAEQQTQAIQEQVAFLQFQQQNPDFNWQTEAAGLQQFIREHPGVNKLPTTTALSLYKKTKAAGTNGRAPAATPPREPRGGRVRPTSRATTLTAEQKEIASRLQLSEADYTKGLGG